MRASIPYYLFFAFVLVFSACSNGQNKKELTVQEFSTAFQKDSHAVLLDVRTPEEFRNGYIKGAVNVDWRNSEFSQKIKPLSKDQPIYVYCLSGGRSADAADYMRKEGFKHVYELKGGITAWRNSNMPEVTPSSTSAVDTGMDKAQFEALLAANESVFVNFYATWCTPCKQMEPYIQTLEKDTQGKVKVIRLDADANKNLLKELHIAAIPTVQLYKKQELVWSHEGYISQEELLQRLK